MSKQIAIGAVAVLPHQMTDGFDEFWKAYPKRPNNPKAPARTAWARAVRVATITDIMEGLARYQFSPEPRYRPHATTWLNQRRWECEDDDLGADPYGLTEFLAALPHDGAVSAHCYDTEDLQEILVATGWPTSWRGHLDVLAGWMRDGYMPRSCAQVIAAAVAEFGTRSTLAAFDKRVRYRANRITGV